MSELLIALLLVGAPIALGWLIADGARRGVIRIPSAAVKSATATCWAFAAAPIAFVVLFELILVRVGFSTGSGLKEGFFDPHAFAWVPASPSALEMPVHAWAALVVFFMAHVAVVAIPTLWPVVRLEQRGRLAKVVRVFLPGYVLVWAVILAQPQGLETWLMGSLFEG